MDGGDDYKIECLYCKSSPVGNDEWVTAYYFTDEVEAARELSLALSLIVECCKGRKESVGGLKFAYVEDSDVAEDACIDLDELKSMVKYETKKRVYGGLVKYDSNDLRPSFNIKNGKRRRSLYPELELSNNDKFTLDDNDSSVACDSNLLNFQQAEGDEEMMEVCCERTDLQLLDSKNEIADEEDDTNSSSFSKKQSRNRESRARQVTGNATRCKPVECIGLTEDVIYNRFPSLSEAGRLLRISDSVLSACCKKKRASAYGYRWRYMEDSNENIPFKEVPILDLSKTIMLNILSAQSKDTLEYELLNTLAVVCQIQETVKLSDESETNINCEDTETKSSQYSVPRCIFNSITEAGKMLRVPIFEIRKCCKDYEIRRDLQVRDIKLKDSSEDAESLFKLPWHYCGLTFHFLDDEEGDASVVGIPTVRMPLKEAESDLSMKNKEKFITTLAAVRLLRHRVQLLKASESTGETGIEHDDAEIVERKSTVTRAALVLIHKVMCSKVTSRISTGNGVDGYDEEVLFVFPSITSASTACFIPRRVISKCCEMNNSKLSSTQFYGIFGLRWSFVDDNSKADSNDDEEETLREPVQDHSTRRQSRTQSRSILEDLSDSKLKITHVEKNELSLDQFLVILNEFKEKSEDNRCVVSLMDVADTGSGDDAEDSDASSAENVALASPKRASVAITNKAAKRSCCYLLLSNLARSDLSKLSRKVNKKEALYLLPLRYFSSVSEASSSLHISQSTISDGCRGLKSNFTGFVWRISDANASDFMLDIDDIVSLKANVRQCDLSSCFITYVAVMSADEKEKHEFFDLKSAANWVYDCKQADTVCIGRVNRDDRYRYEAYTGQLFENMMKVLRAAIRRETIREYRWEMSLRKCERVTDFVSDGSDLSVEEESVRSSSSESESSDEDIFNEREKPECNIGDKYQVSRIPACVAIHSVKNGPTTSMECCVHSNEPISARTTVNVITGSNVIKQGDLDVIITTVTSVQTTVVSVMNNETRDRYLLQARYLQYPVGMVTRYFRSPAESVGSIVVVLQNDYVKDITSLPMSMENNQLTVCDGRTVFQLSPWKLQSVIKDDAALEVLRDKKFIIQDALGEIQLLASTYMNNKIWRVSWLRVYLSVRFPELEKVSSDCPLITPNFGLDAKQFLYSGSLYTLYKKFCRAMEIERAKEELKENRSPVLRSGYKSEIISSSEFRDFHFHFMPPIVAPAGISKENNQMTFRSQRGAGSEGGDFSVDIDYDCEGLVFDTTELCKLYLKVFSLAETIRTGSSVDISDFT